MRKGAGGIRTQSEHKVGDMWAINSPKACGYTVRRWGPLGAIAEAACPSRPGAPVVHVSPIRSPKVSPHYYSRTQSKTDHLSEVRG